MLILTRKINQKLIINDNIEVVILESYKNCVKIGVNAPSNVQIYREEVYNEIKKSNKQANKIDVDIISNLKTDKKIETNFKGLNFSKNHKWGRSSIGKNRPIELRPQLWFFYVNSSLNSWDWLNVLHYFTCS